MDVRQIKFTLDCSKVGNQICLEGIRQGDDGSVQFVITLVDGTKPFANLTGENIVATLFGVKPDGTKICNSCEIDSDGKVIYTLHLQDTSCVGMVLWQLVIAESVNGQVQVVAEPDFSCVVESVIVDYKNIMSSDEFNALIIALAEARKCSNQYNSISAEIETARGSYDSLGKRLDNKIDNAEGSVITKNIANQSVTAAKIAEGAVWQNHIKNGEINNDKLAYNSITKDKLTVDFQNEFDNKLDIISCSYGIDLKACIDQNKIYYFGSGIQWVNGNEIQGGAGNYVGYVKYNGSNWIMLSYSGIYKGIYKIDTNGNIEPIADTQVTENSNNFVTSGAVYNSLAKKANFKNIYYNAGGTGELGNACDPDTIYNVCFNAPCNNVAQGTKGILFATDENTQIFIADNGNIYHRYYNLTDDMWSEFTSVISQKVNSVNGVFPDNLGNVDLLVECGYGTDLADCTDKSRIYYFHSGIIGLRGSNTDFGGVGMYVGFVKKVNNGWLFISTGEGNKKSNYRIFENGETKLIGSSYDYNNLSNKPAINNVELTGNKTLSDLGLYTKEQVDEIIANQSVSGSGTLSINSSNGSSDVISSATYYYVKRGELVTLFCSIKFNAGSCSYVGFDRLPFNYNNKVGQLRTYAATNKGEMFRVAVSSGMLFIASASSTATRTQDEELNFSITYTTNS